MSEQPESNPVRETVPDAPKDGKVKIIEFSKLVIEPRAEPLEAASNEGVWATIRKLEAESDKFIGPFRVVPIDAVINALKPRE